MIAAACMADRRCGCKDDAVARKRTRRCWDRIIIKACLLSYLSESSAPAKQSTSNHLSTPTIIRNPTNNLISNLINNPSKPHHPTQTKTPVTAMMSPIANPLTLTLTLLALGATSPLAAAMPRAAAAPETPHVQIGRAVHERAILSKRDCLYSYAADPCTTCYDGGACNEPSSPVGIGGDLGW